MKPIKKNRLVISIARPATEIFSFLLDPTRSSAWQPGVIRQEVSKTPVEEGVTYRTYKADGTRDEYVVTSLDPNKSFIMRMVDGNYHVRYTLLPISLTETEFEYYEWVIRDTLENPFLQEGLGTVKSILESEK